MSNEASIAKLVAGGLVVAFGGAAVYSSAFIIDQTDMGNVRHLGEKKYEEPLGPGLHFKWPFIDNVDHLQVSQRTLHIPKFKVNTIDNQQIELDLNFNYTVPKHKVNHLLYEIGKAGQGDIDSNIIPVVMDKARSVFNQQNTTTISQNSKEIQAEVTASVFKILSEQFGITPHTLQFAQIGYSPAFVASNEKAVTAKNDAIAEQNKKAVEEAKAAQKVIQATAEADAAIQKARGESQSVLLNAQAEKTRAELAGQGEKSRLAAEITALGGNPETYIKYLQARAQQNWDGKAPQVVGGNGGGSPTVVVPMPGR